MSPFKCFLVLLCVLLGAPLSLIAQSPISYKYPPKSISGTWKICRTIVVAEIVGDKPDWNLNPIGKLINFGKTSVTFEKAAHPILGYRADEFKSAGDFEAIYGISAKRVGIGPRQISITAQLADRDETGIVTSEVYPIDSRHIILNWERWFLSAVRAVDSCGRDQ